MTRKLHKRKKDNKKKGFTLVELIVVVAILGILAVITIPRFSQYVAQAKYQKMVSNQRVVYETLVATETKLFADRTITDDYSEAKGILAEEANKQLTGIKILCFLPEEGLAEDEFMFERWDGTPTKVPSEFTIQSTIDGKTYTFFNGKDITE